LHERGGKGVGFEGGDHAFHVGALERMAPMPWMPAMLALSENSTVA
jgi:hypothetical protein